MPHRPDAEAWLRLALAPGLGAAALRRLIDAYGQAEAIESAAPAERARIAGQPGGAERATADPGALRAALAWLEGPDRWLITLADDDYPALLREIADPPPLLYALGRRALLAHTMLAVVGSRNASPGGLDNARSLARALSDAGLTVVSGLALGIDAAAHEGGLLGASSTVAVVGTGLDIVYPAANRELAHRIARDGLLLSEFPLGTRALASHFPRRNRVISGLARGVLVVEAALSSGSLITARLALEQGREVFAVPGSIHSPQAKGCHALIKEGAKLTENAADVLGELAWPTPAPLLPDRGAADAGDEPLLEAMGHDPVGLDLICARSGLPADAASAALLALELSGKVVQLPGGKYQRRS